MMQKFYFYIAAIFAINAFGTSAKKQCDGVCYKSSKVLSNPATEEEATLQARCLAVCVDKGQWYSIDYHNITSNCTYYQLMIDCQRGCAIQSKNINLTIDQCGYQCLQECPNSTVHYYRTPCNVSCDYDMCTFGCDTYKRTSKQTNDTTFGLNHTLSDPATLPILREVEYEADNGEHVYNPGEFVYTVTSPPSFAIKANNKSEMTLFVFKIDTRKNNTYYLWTTSSTGFLDLKFLTCETVNVSYKAVTQSYTTDYSYHTTITIGGISTPEQYPGQVDHNTITSSFKEDFRENYDRHAIATFSWTLPENATFISNYRLNIISPQNECGAQEYCVDKDVTNITITANSPNEPLFFGCEYIVQLITDPIRPDDVITNHGISINPEVSDAEMSIHCTRTYQNNGKLTLYAVWNVKNSPRLIDAIKKFTVLTQEVDLSVRNWVKFIRIHTVVPNVNKTINNAAIPNLSPLENIQRKYKIRVEALSNNLYPWRQMPRYVSCIIDSHPEPPSLINSSDITINGLVFTSRHIYFNVSWKHPTIANGNITMFELRLIHDLNYEVDYYFTHKVQGNIHEVIIDTDAIYQIQTINCIYLQIRSKNNYLWSNWSYPIPLSKHSQDPYCEMSIVPTPSSMLSVATTTPPTKHLVAPIVGGIFGGIVILVILAAICGISTILGQRYHRRNKYLEAFKDDSPNSMYIRGPMSPVSTSVTKPLELPKLDEWEIPAEHVIIEKRLGEGCFGEVYQGMVKGPISNPKVQASFKNIICPVVAIKLLKTTASGSEKVDFLQEIETMKTVAKGNNPHVVNMVGCVTIQEPLCLITEFVKHGDLHSYLTAIRKMVTQTKGLAAQSKCDAMSSNPYIATFNDDDNEEYIKMGTATDNTYDELGEVDVVNLLSFAYQIASGMEFLASLGIVHRDLASRNILVDDGKNLKISDFGMSRTIAADDVYVKNTRGRLPWKWMAIESIVNREFTSASDVWAYGVTIWEIATLGGFPYPTISNAQLLDHLQKGLRLEKPDNCSQEIYEIMQECWIADPSGRPTFTTLRGKFDSLITSQQDHVPYIDLDIDSCKPYYTALDDSDKDCATSESSEMSAESSNFPCKLGMLPTFEDEATCHASNTYVETPTKLNPYDFENHYDDIDVKVGPKEHQMTKTV